MMKDKVFYEDFGAIGDGVADDFYAVRAAHAYANEHKLPVYGKRGASYRFGKGSGTDTITVMTDTHWCGARLIFDDSEMQPGMPEYRTPIITVAPDGKKAMYNETDSPISSIYKGASNIGFAPGFRAMVVLYNDAVRQYIRDAGIISDDGTAQREFVMVDKDGNIDPDTPLQWNYDRISTLEVIPVDDAPITISGDEEGRQGIIETVSNHALEMNRYLLRVIKICRSNVTFKNVCHMVTKEEISDTGSPYEGFTHIMNAENVRFENLTLQRYRVFDTHYRSYEIRATMSNKISWVNSGMSNFFSENAYPVHQGMMGTNYCKNLSFDNVEFNTFDCHHGCYNIDIRNSRLVYLSAIGEGTLRVENCEFYICDHCIVIWLRSDYGTTWYGDLIMKNIRVNYSPRNKYIALVNAWWVDHWFGYPAKLPTNIYLDGLSIRKYEAGFDADGVRYEKTLSENADPVNFFLPDVANFTDRDISRHVSEGGGAEHNPFKAPEALYIDNYSGCKINLPNTPMFRDMRVYVEGNEIDWKKNNGI